MEPDDTRQLIRECLDAPGEASARARADRLAHLYAGFPLAERLEFLTLLARDFATDAERVERMARARLEVREGSEQHEADIRLRDALVPPFRLLLRRFTTVPGGIKFLVDLRSDLLRIAATTPQLAELDTHLKEMLSRRFDLGILQFRRITWDSPAALLEKLVEYEEVHAVRSWRDLRNRLDHDRRWYALFHPSVPREPLAFVQVALVRGMSSSLQKILDENAPVEDAGSADTAVFYSISSVQHGLRGISFGEFLIKRAVDELSHELPKLRTYATLSPIPGFRVWLEGLESHANWERAQVLSESERRALVGDASSAGDGDLAILRRILSDSHWTDRAATRDALEAPITRLCARYFSETRAGGEPIDPVARFHLRNGARLERINWLGNTTARGIRRAYGMMVNYRYDLDALDARQDAYERKREIAMSEEIRAMLDPSEAGGALP